jgi:hypothetical protein
MHFYKLKVAGTFHALYRRALVWNHVSTALIAAGFAFSIDNHVYGWAMIGLGAVAWWPTVGAENRCESFVESNLSACRPSHEGYPSPRVHQ